MSVQQMPSASPVSARAPARRPSLFHSAGPPRPGLWPGSRPCHWAVSAVGRKGGEVAFSSAVLSGVDRNPVVEFGMLSEAGDEPCHDDHDTVQYFVCGRHHRGAWVARRGYRAVLLLRHMHTAAPIWKIAPRTVGPRRTVPASGEKPVCAVTIPPARKPRPDTAPTQPSQRG
jgi:hypothetical protein